MIINIILTKNHYITLNLKTMQTQKYHLEGELFEWTHPLCVLHKLLFYDIETIQNKRKQLKNKIKNL